MDKKPKPKRVRKLSLSPVPLEKVVAGVGGSPIADGLAARTPVRLGLGVVRH
jgi:hypothetical protein